MVRLKDKAKNKICAVIGVLFFLVMLNRVNWQDMVDFVADIRWESLFLVVFFTVLPVLLNGVVVSKMLQTIDHPIRFGQSAKLQIMRTFYNLVSPGASLGGEAVAAHMLKQQFGGYFSYFLGLMIFERFLRTVLAVLVVGPALVFLLIQDTRSLPVYFVVAMFCFLGLLVWLVAVYIRQGKPLSGLITKILGQNAGKKISGFEEYFVQFFALNPKRMIVLMFLDFVVIVLIMVRIASILWVMGIEVNLSVVSLVYLIENIVVFVPVPGALGFFEGIQIQTFQWVGNPSAAGFVFSLYYRIGQLVMLAIFLPVVLRTPLFLTPREQESLPKTVN